MAAALGHLQLEETSSAMEGLLSFYLHCLGSTSMWQDLWCLSVCLSVSPYVCSIYRPLQQHAAGLLLWAPLQAISISCCMARLQQAIHICSSMAVSKCEQCHVVS